MTISPSILHRFFKNKLPLDSVSKDLCDKYKYCKFKLYVQRKIYLLWDQTSEKKSAVTYFLKPLYYLYLNESLDFVEMDKILVLY